MAWIMSIGAQPDAAGTLFRVWAADASQVEVVLYQGDQIIATHQLQAEDNGYFAAHIADVKPGAYYMYRMDGGDPRPDPASRFQPMGVHSPSQVIDPSFNWTDGNWRGIALEDVIVYEVHVGTATPEGTFDALIERLDDIRDLGATVVEIMPIAAFPGDRNWGYDGVDLFAPARAYGPPEGLKRFVDAAHLRGIGVFLDVVYNHLGPDGNYLREFSKSYFTDRHKTPWGDALNFDGPGSAPVREFFIANACYWANEYHLDGLRLDATHAILDDSPTHILTEINMQVHGSLPSDRHFLFIAEDERNDAGLVRPPFDGLGLDGVWADDFHHEVRVALTGEQEGYYADFTGRIEDIVTTLRQGWFYTGQESKWLDEPRGTRSDDVPPPRFVHCIQNHDQIGNRALGERLNHDIELDAYRAVSALLLFSPYTPMLFMGQEWAATTPFLYFTDHHAELGKLVTEGRRAEFKHFTAFSGEKVPDPQARDTFLQSKLRWEERDDPTHASMLDFYRDLLDLRRKEPALYERSRKSFTVVPLSNTALALRRTGPVPEDTLLMIFNLRGKLDLDLMEQPETTPPIENSWIVLLDSEAPRYGGRGITQLGADYTRLAIEGARAIILGVD